MTGRFDDMEGFIPAVVAEHQARENKKRELGESGEASDDLDDEIEEEGYDFTNRLIGNARAQRTRNHEYLARRQRQASRKKYYQSVAPRLEILENMPFFIPFATRVQIFRQFIHDDQVTRRNGMIDPDNWRMSIMSNSMRSPSGGPSGHEIIGKHHANIHRESVFEDAYDQFYSLGEGLKEPIQITFVDKFDTVEAGIDGGGVTKEFLTSVTNEAFDPSNGLNLFLENEQHLLYPDPTSVEHRKDLLRQAGFVEGSPEWNHHIRELLKRYEFLGRVIGKCLYEGILVDVNFVGFFLLKWALTGGAHSAAKETQYRATFNDLRDLDEGLYQGLVSVPHVSPKCPV
jgi:ubiquitin-protein ligase E3 C